MTAACAQRELTVRLALEWLAAGGHIKLGHSGDDVQLSPGDAKPDASLRDDLHSSIKSLVEETAAYRSHFHTADAKTLL
jgi:hypothetical protein